MAEFQPDSCNTVAYIRRSTFKQENEHQYSAIREWLADRDIELGNITVYAETGSGASQNREQLREMMEAIEDGDIKHVVVWELSRIARVGRLAQEFFDLCEDYGVTVHVTSGSLRRLEPDGSNRFVADILAAVYAEERRTLIRRTKYGLERARSQDKWTTQPPLGFTTDDEGYLIPRFEPYIPEDDPDVDGPDADGAPDPKDSFFDIKNALERIAAGESQRKVAEDFHAARNSLRRVFNEEQHRPRYLELEDPEDERVDAALEILRREDSRTGGFVLDEFDDSQEVATGGQA